GSIDCSPAPRRSKSSRPSIRPCPPADTRAARGHPPRAASHPERRSEMTTPTIAELALAARRRLAATGWQVDTLDEITEGNGTAKEIVLQHRKHPGRLIVRTHLDGTVTIAAERAPADWAAMIAILLADLSESPIGGELAERLQAERAERERRRAAGEPGYVYPAEGGDRQ